MFKQHVLRIGLFLAIFTAIILIFGYMVGDLVTVTNWLTKTIEGRVCSVIVFLVAVLVYGGKFHDWFD